MYIKKNNYYLLTNAKNVIAKNEYFLSIYFLNLT